jgi:hypothetical protein
VKAFREDGTNAMHAYTTNAALACDLKQIWGDMGGPVMVKAASHVENLRGASDCGERG